MRVPNYLVSVARFLRACARLPRRLRYLRACCPLPKRMKNEIIRAHLRLGRPMPAGPIDLLGYKISYLGEPQFRYLFNEIFMQAPYFFKSSNDPPLIFDCGSNIGMSVLFFKKLYPNARIVAFETDPFTFEILRRNVIKISYRTSTCIKLHSQVASAKLSCSGMLQQRAQVLR